jgi:hypothetical protein
MFKQGHTLFFFRKRTEKPPAKKSNKAALRKSLNVETINAETSKIGSTKTSTTRDIQLPKSKQEVFKMFNLSTTNQILQVILGCQNCKDHLIIARLISKGGR